MATTSNSKIPLRMGAISIVGGIVLIFAVNYVAGGQPTSLTQLPYVLAAMGAGVGLVAFGSGLMIAQRQQLGRRRVENALARALVATARLSAAREAAAPRRVARSHRDGNPVVPSVGK